MVVFGFSSEGFDFVAFCFKQIGEELSFLVFFVFFGKGFDVF